MELAELEVKYKEMGEAIERLKALKGRWKPEVNEYCYYIAGAGNPLRWTFRGNNTDGDIVSLANVYKTEEEAQYEVNRRKAIVEVNDIIEELNDGWVPDWSSGRDKFFLQYDMANSRLVPVSNEAFKTPLELGYFNSGNFDKIQDRITQEQIKLIWRL